MRLGRHRNPVFNENEKEIIFMSDTLVLIFQFIVLIFSVMIHEISHGFVAERLGDKTARDAGRLTLNPLKHIDPFGSVILPLLLYIANTSILFGWAKPVPYNPYNLKNPKKGGALIALSGPASNFLIALIFGILIRVGSTFGYLPDSSLSIMFQIVVYINVLLGVFNLVPIPPLDGSKVLFGFLPARMISQRAFDFLERNGMMILVLFMFFGFQLIRPIISWLFGVFTGLAF